MSTARGGGGWERSAGGRARGGGEGWEWSGGGRGAEERAVAVVERRGAEEEGLTETEMGRSDGMGMGEERIRLGRSVRLGGILS